MQRERLVHGVVQTDGVNYVKINKITKNSEAEAVYNMEVDGFHNFAVNNGAIVHNCMDAMRYALEEYIIKNKWIC